MKIKNLLMKRVPRAVLICLLLSVVGMMKSFAYGDFSAECSTGQTLYYNITDAENLYVELTYPGPGSVWNPYYWEGGYTKPIGNIILPNHVEYDGNTYTVTSIGDHAFYRCSDLTGPLTIPNTVTSIGEWAFADCTGFSGILTFSNSVTSIGVNAFSRCYYLTDVNYQGNIAQWCGISFGDPLLGSFNLYINSNLVTNLAVPETVTEIKDYAFTNCISITGNLTIPNSVIRIGKGAFSGCNGFDGNLTISNSVVTIDESAFSGCSGFIGDLIIPNSVTTIGGWAFSSCSGFNGNLTIPNLVATIEGGVFSGCSGFIGDLIIPNSVTTIGGWAFSGCSGFTGDLIIPNSVTAIGESAFENCSGNMTIGNSVTTIGKKAFYQFNSLSEELIIPNSVTTIGESAFEGCTGFSGDLVIPNSVTAIGKYAFSDCSSFTGNLTISNSLTTIDDGTFSSCYGFSGDLNIPNSVTTIGYGAFYECYGFTDGILTIPNSVTTIEGYAFAGGIDFAEVHYNTATCEGSYYYSAPPFLGCGGRLIIGDNVETMPAYMFYVSYFTEAITLGTNPPTIEDYVFEATDFPIYVPYESLNAYKTATNWNSYESRIHPWLQKSITGYGTSTESDKWVFIASPVATEGGIAPVAVDNLIGSLIPESTLYDYDLYRFNQSADLEWENYNNPDHTADFKLVNGQGYLYASKEGVNLVFKGTFNEDETKDVELVYDAGKELAGWNLVGNPFPVTATVTGRSYYVMNEAGTGINPEAVSAGGTIAACTGIVVKAEENETDPQVTFTRTTQQSAANQGTLQIAVAQNNIRSNAIQDNAIVSFNEGDQLAKFYFGKQNANIYIPQGAEEYAIAYSNGQGEMPLNLKAKENGEYTISVNPENVEMNYLHLIDNMTGADIDLLATPSYTFNAKTTDYESRFRLVFSAIGDENGGNENAPFAFVSNGQIIITGIDGDACNATLQMVDVMGRVLVCREAMVASPISTTGMAPGVYVLRLVCGDNVRTQKMVIQ